MIPTVLFVMWRSLGHLNASFGVARRLEALGYTVVYIGPEDIHPLVTRQGFRFGETGLFQYFRVPIGIGRRIGDLMLGLGELPKLFQRIREGRAEYRRIRAAAPTLISEMRSVIERYNPRFLVFDPFLLHFYIPVYKFGVPAVALSTKSLASRGRDVPPYTSMTVPRLTRMSRLKIGAEWTIQRLRYISWNIYERVLFGGTPYVVAKWLSQIANFPLREEWATRSIITDLRFKCVQEWVLHAPEFDFPRTTVERGGAVYLGPCVDMTRKEEVFEWDLLPDGRLLCCMLTSVFHPGSAATKRRIRFLRELLEAIRTLPDMVLIVATGKGITAVDLGPLPQNAIVVEKLPALDAMRRAELILTQAGGNSAKEAILTGVPLLVFPDATDQPGFSARLEFHRLAFRYPLRRARASRISELITRSLMDVGMHHRLSEMSDVLRRSNEDLPRFSSVVDKVDRLRNRLTTV